MYENVPAIIRKDSAVIRRFLRNEDGQDVIEWGFLATFLGIVLITAVSWTGIDTAISNWYTTVTDTIVNASF